MIRGALCALVLLAPMPAAAAGQGGTVYLCERDAIVEAIYLNEPDPPQVVLHVEGRMVSLPLSPAASGARYGGEEDGYQWWTKGDGAMLDWIEDGRETPIYRACLTTE